MNIEPYYIFNGHAYPPQESGCYSFYNRLGVCLYVGQSKNLKKRYIAHKSTCDYFDNVHFIGIWQCNQRDMDLIEEWLFVKLQPIKNKLKLEYYGKNLKINCKNIELVSTKSNHNGRYNFKYLQLRKSINGNKWT